LEANAMGDVVISRRCSGAQRPVAAAVWLLAAAVGCTSSRPARVVEAQPARSAPAVAAAPATTPASPSTEAKATSATAEIRSLELREGAPEVYVDLEASAPLVWTSFRNPEGKVVVELPNSVPAPRIKDLVPEDGLVSSVQVQRETEGSRPMTRLVIATRHEVEHSVTADGLHLQIRLLPLETQAKVVAREPAKPKLAFEPVPPPPPGVAGGGAEAPPPASAPPAPAPSGSSGSGGAQPVAPQTAPAAPAAAGTPDEPAVAPAPSGATATRLESVEVLAGEGGRSVVRISGDGEFPYATFALSEPSRFVIDLQGVVNRSPRAIVPVPGGVVERVRIAQFKPGPGPKSVARVVFDLKRSAMPQIERTPRALVVSFPEAPAASASPAPAGAAAPAPAPAEPAAAPSAAAAAPAPSAAGSTPAAPETETAPVTPPRPKSRAGKGSRAAAKSVPAPAAPAPAASETAAPAGAQVQIAQATPPPPPPSPPPPAAAPPSDLALRPPPSSPAARRPAGIEVEDAAQAPGGTAAGKPKGGAAGSGLPRVAQGANSLQQPSADLGRGQASIGGSAGEKLGRDVSGEQKNYTGEPIDLKVTNADVTEVLRSFAQISGLNIVVQPGVTGTVTAELENVPWDQAFEEVLKINNLGYEREGNVIRIAPTAVLRQEAQERQQLAQARALVIPLRTVMRRLSYANASNIANLLRTGTGLLTQRGSVIVDDRTNTLIIKELPDFLDAVLAVISNLDTPEPQVMIEARIIETTKDFSRTLGISWGFNAVADAAHGNTTGLIFPNNITAGPQSGALNNVNLLTGSQNGSIDVRLGNVLNTFTLDMQLQAAEHEGLLNILSAPKVATLNNQLAYIQSGIQWPVQTIANNTVTTQYINATLRLEVTPQVTAEGTILMDIAISKKEPVTALIVTGATNAPISTKDARTRLVVRDGGTAVIGGIYKVTSNSSEDRVPGLANIPIVGHLFRNKARSESNDELLIFITPRVIKI
jgi:type IV pilus assembly protein PilQ